MAPPRSVERGQKSVAGGLDLAAAESVQLPTHRGVVAIEEIPPPAVAELGGVSWTRPCR
jgi:hypothetical protein